MVASLTSSSWKRFVPAPLKRAAKEALLNRTLYRAVRQIRALPYGELPTREMLENLQRGWGNEGFAAQTDYLAEVAGRAAKTSGPILECGSGLTTILMGLLAGRRGVKTWSLEHHSEWRSRVIGVLERFEIRNVSVCHAPLRPYERFAWYDISLTEIPERFELVICDGPPGSTEGGRYGLLPVLGERLPPGSTILLDDAGRAGEAEVLERWSLETNLNISRRESDSGSFAIVTRI